MKKKLVGTFLAVAFAMLGFAPLTASAAAPQTDVTGVITANSVVVSGAFVTVMCQGFTQTDTTDAHGSYLVIFTTAQCPFGSTVKVMAQKGGHSGTSTGTAQGLTTKLNVAIVNVSIPEFGWIAGIIAIGTGIGAIAFTRRRSHQGMIS